MRFTILLSLYTSIASSSYAFTSSLSYSIMKRRNNDGIYKSKLRAMYDVQEATQILQGELISYLFILCIYVHISAFNSKVVQESYLLSYLEKYMTPSK